jgi:hypothetical protein
VEGKRKRRKRKERRKKRKKKERKKRRKRDSRKRERMNNQRKVQTRRACLPFPFPSPFASNYGKFLFSLFPFFLFILAIFLLLTIFNPSCDVFPFLQLYRPSLAPLSYPYPLLNTHIHVSILILAVVRSGRNIETLAKSQRSPRHCDHKQRWNSHSIYFE